MGMECYCSAGDDNRRIVWSCFVIAGLSGLCLMRVEHFDGCAKALIATPLRALMVPGASSGVAAWRHDIIIFLRHDVLDARIFLALGVLPTRDEFGRALIFRLEYTGLAVLFLWPISRPAYLPPLITGN